MASIGVPAGALRLSPTYIGYSTSDSIGAFPVAPTYLPDQRSWLIQLAFVMNGMMKGKTNNTGRVTLTENSATTVVTLAPNLLGKDTLVILSPLTSTAATEFGAGTIYVSDTDVINNQFTITHVNSATSGRKFGYILIG